MHDYRKHSPFTLAPGCSLVGAAIICCSSLFVAVSQRRQAAAAKAAAAAAAAAAVESSVRRASSARLRQASASRGGGTLQQPLLLGSEELEGGSEGEGGTLPSGRRSRERSLAGGSSEEDWASAVEGGLSAAASLRTAPSWRSGGSGSGSEGEAGAVPGLKADLKEVLALEASRVSAEVQQPGTPAAPPHMQQHPSAESLPPLGASPDGHPQMPPLTQHGSKAGIEHRGMEEGGR